MTSAAIQNIEDLAPTWRELESQTRVKLRAIGSERHYKEMVSLMNTLIDRVGDRESHILTGLLDVVSAFVSDYEKQNVEIPTASPAAVLQFLMEQRKLRQIDLAEDFGSQSNVSEVLSGKREINARQARSLRSFLSCLYLTADCDYKAWAPGYQRDLDSLGPPCLRCRSVELRLGQPPPEAVSPPQPPFTYLAGNAKAMTRSDVSVECEAPPTDSTMYCRPVFGET